MTTTLTNTGWVGSTAATGAAAPSPVAPALGEIAFGATVVGLAADALSQLAKPNVGQYAYQSVIAGLGQIAGDRAPQASLVVNGASAVMNNAPFAGYVQDWLSRQSKAIFNFGSNGATN